MRFADLHLHTNFSDGTYTPEELINRVSTTGIESIAITDHDTVDGIPTAIEAANKKDIEVIPAIELSTEYDGLEIHILGYLIDYKKEELIDKLDFLKKNRQERIYKMLSRLKEMDVFIKAEDVFKLAGSGTVGRLHLARILLKEGYANSIYDAFAKYIGERAPAYVCGFHLSPYEAIKLIKDVGGISVLAHPLSMKRDDLIPLFIDYGMRGLEVYYPEHSKATTEYYKGLADKYSLLITGGSDYHGDAKPEVQLGSIKLPYALVEKLKEEKSKI